MFNLRGVYKEKPFEDPYRVKCWWSRLVMCSLALAFLLGMILPAVATAHPPKEVTLSYDTKAKVLKVQILHTSPAPSWHYIKTVAVEKNKQPVATYPYQSQPAKEFTYEYEVAALPGDTLVVTVTCNMYGSRTESLTIPAVANP